MEVVCRELDLNYPKRVLLDNDNIIYGAGYNGRLLFQKLKVQDVDIAGFYDDDSTRWGGYCEECRILNRKELSSLDRDKTNIIISSMYVPAIAAKVKAMGFANCFAAFRELLDKDTKDFEFEKHKGRSDYISRFESLKEKMSDVRSKQYFDVLIETLKSGRALPRIRDVYSDEKQYLLNCFSGKLDGFIFLDAGAYTGDTVREVMNEGVNPEAIYCFEADRNNFAKLKDFKESLEENEWIHIENLALWNTHTKLGMKFQNYNARIDDNASEHDVETAVIDEYFSHIHIDFVKMDIEGAERHALEGGRVTIQRDRPVLAISMYHGVDDMVVIPEMLMSMCENYFFFVRHHSYTYSETVLYGVPEEKKSLLIN